MLGSKLRSRLRWCVVKFGRRPDPTSREQKEPGSRLSSSTESDQELSKWVAMLPPLLQQLIAKGVSPADPNAPQRLSASQITVFGDHGLLSLTKMSVRFASTASMSVQSAGMKRQQKWFERNASALLTSSAPRTSSHPLPPNTRPKETSREDLVIAVLRGMAKKENSDQQISDFLLGLMHTESGASDGKQLLDAISTELRSVVKPKVLIAVAKELAIKKPEILKRNSELLLMVSTLAVETGDVSGALHLVTQQQALEAPTTVGLLGAVHRANQRWNGHDGTKRMAARMLVKTMVLQLNTQSAQATNSRGDLGTRNSQRRDVLAAANSLLDCGSAIDALNAIAPLVVPSLRSRSEDNCIEDVEAAQCAVRTLGALGWWKEAVQVFSKLVAGTQSSVALNMATPERLLPLMQVGVASRVPWLICLALDRASSSTMHSWFHGNESFARSCVEVLMSDPILGRECAMRLRPFLPIAQNICLLSQAGGSWRKAVALLAHKNTAPANDVQGSLEVRDALVSLATHTSIPWSVMYPTLLHCLQVGLLNRVNFQDSLLQVLYALQLGHEAYRVEDQLSQASRDLTRALATANSTPPALGHGGHRDLTSGEDVFSTSTTDAAHRAYALLNSDEHRESGVRFLQNAVLSEFTGAAVYFAAMTLANSGHPVHAVHVAALSGAQRQWEAALDLISATGSPSRGLTQIIYSEAPRHISDDAVKAFRGAGCNPDRLLETISGNRGVVVIQLGNCADKQGRRQRAGRGASTYAITVDDTRVQTTDVESPDDVDSITTKARRNDIPSAATLFSATLQWAHALDHISTISAVCPQQELRSRARKLAFITPPAAHRAAIAHFLNNVEAAGHPIGVQLAEAILAGCIEQKSLEGSQAALQVLSDRNLCPSVDSLLAAAQTFESDLAVLIPSLQRFPSSKLIVPMISAQLWSNLALETSRSPTAKATSPTKDQVQRTLATTLRMLTENAANTLATIQAAIAVARAHGIAVGVAVRTSEGWLTSHGNRVDELRMCTQAAQWRCAVTCLELHLATKPEGHGAAHQHDLSASPDTKESFEALSPVLSFSRLRQSVQDFPSVADHEITQSVVDGDYGVVHHDLRSLKIAVTVARRVSSAAPCSTLVHVVSGIVRTCTVPALARATRDLRSAEALQAEAQVKRPVPALRQVHDSWGALHRRMVFGAPTVGTTSAQYTSSARRSQDHRYLRAVSNYRRVVEHTRRLYQIVASQLVSEFRSWDLALALLKKSPASTTQQIAIASRPFAHPSVSAARMRRRDAAARTPSAVSDSSMPRATCTHSGDAGAFCDATSASQ